MAPKKLRILFVLSQLVQHGSERYLFEICRALDKASFEPEVLTRPFLVKHQYYYRKLRELGIPVRRRLISRRFFIYPIKPLYRRSVLVRSIVDILHRAVMRVAYVRTFDSFDLIAVIGMETYCDALTPKLDTNRNVVVHHVNHEFQFERDYYAEFPQRQLVVLDGQQVREIRASSIRDADLFLLPLPMRLRDRSPIDLTAHVPSVPIRIGVVSRLFRDRPNEPLLRCFAAVARRIDAELYFYGGGNPALYSNLIDELGIRERVTFPGHQSDLRASIVRDNLSMLWLVSMGSSISYGSIEVASLGMPMVFWNMAGTPHETVLVETDGAINAFAETESFAEFVVSILADSDGLRCLGQRLRNYVIRTFDVDERIHELEDYYRERASAAEQLREPLI